ncbi:MAG TPA: PadR family transcriptional regulator [Chroococcales cyanobacterium]
MFGKGWQGFEGPKERLFEKGDLKYVVLDLLAERPRHGYDIIQALEERHRGRYSPSPGSVYPILQMLEDMGYVSAEAREGRKVYTVTDSGRAFLEENRRTLDEIRARVERCQGFHGELHEAMHEIGFELKELTHLFARQTLKRQLTPEKIRLVRAVISKARHEIETILIG